MPGRGHLPGHRPARRSPCLADAKRPVASVEAASVSRATGTRRPRSLNVIRPVYAQEPSLRTRAVPGTAVVAGNG